MEEGDEARERRLNDTGEEENEGEVRAERKRCRAETLIKRGTQTQHVCCCVVMSHFSVLSRGCTASSGQMERPCASLVFSKHKMGDHFHHREIV